MVTFERLNSRSQANSLPKGDGFGRATLARRSAISCAIWERSCCEAFWKVASVCRRRRFAVGSFIQRWTNRGSKVRAWRRIRRAGLTAKCNMKHRTATNESRAPRPGHEHRAASMVAPPDLWRSLSAHERRRSRMAPRLQPEVPAIGEPSADRAKQSPNR